MNVKRLITGLALSMLLSSGAANADWGDVYYCQMTNFVVVALDGTKTNYELETFQFKLDQTRNAMVFGDKGYFGALVLELKPSSQIKKEIWAAADSYSLSEFRDGKFLYSSMLGRALALSANCDKF